MSKNALYLIKKEKLLKMTRRELIGELVIAEEEGKDKLVELIMEVMAETQIDYGPKAKPKRGFFTTRKGNII